MRFDVLTLFPELFDAARTGVTGRAFRELGHELATLNYRAFAGNPFGHVDAPPFGGGPGMVLRPDVLRDALATLPRRRRGAGSSTSPPRRRPWTTPRWWNWPPWTS